MTAAQDPGLVYCDQAARRYGWRTDAASGAISAGDARTAVGMLVDQGEWSRPDSGAERGEIEDGAWLQITDADGCIVLRRGEVP